MALNFRVHSRILLNLGSVVLSESLPRVYHPLISRGIHGRILPTLEDNPTIYENLLQSTYLLPEKGHNVLIIQPEIKHGTMRRQLLGLSTIDCPKNHSRSPDLEEAKALVDSLAGWTTVGTAVFNLRGVAQSSRERFFTNGVWEDVSDTVKLYRNGDKSGETENKLSFPANDPICDVNPIVQPRVTAVFVNWPRLSTPQVVTMQRTWKLPVYDRYTLVVQLFNLRARTLSARLQAQLAELGLLQARLSALFSEPTSGAELSTFGRMSSQKVLQLIKEKEGKILGQLSVAEQQRTATRQQRREKRTHQFPAVTVVGYTNAGKTSLIRYLSGDSKICSSPQVFATLDITHHRIRLPTVDPSEEADKDGSEQPKLGLPGVKLLLLDTIGFMSDLPINLIAAFRATLEECLDTDLILHVVDVSEAHWEERVDYVDRILLQSGVPIRSDEQHAVGNSSTRDGRSNTPLILHVGNKEDRGLEHVSDVNRSKLDITVSIKNGSGMKELAQRIENELIKKLGWLHRTVEVRQGSQVLQWLYSNAMVKNVSVSPRDPERLHVSALFTPITWNRLVHQFNPTTKSGKVAKSSR